MWTIGNKYHVIAILLLLFSGDYLLFTPIITFYTLHKSMWNVLDLCGVNDVERDLLCNRRRIQLQKNELFSLIFFLVSISLFFMMIKNMLIIIPLWFQYQNNVLVLIERNSVSQNNNSKYKWQLSQRCWKFCITRLVHCATNQN